MAPTFNPRTQEAAAGRTLSSKSAWSTEQVSGQPELHREILSQKPNLPCQKKFTPASP